MGEAGGQKIPAGGSGNQKPAKRTGSEELQTATVVSTESLAVALESTPSTDENYQAAWELRVINAARKYRVSAKVDTDGEQIDSEQALQLITDTLAELTSRLDDSVLRALVKALFADDSKQQRLLSKIDEGDPDSRHRLCLQIASALLDIRLDHRDLDQDLRSILVHEGLSGSDILAIVEGAEFQHRHRDTDERSDEREFKIPGTAQKDFETSGHASLLNDLPEPSRWHARKADSEDIQGQAGATEKNSGHKCEISTDAVEDAAREVGEEVLEQRLDEIGEAILRIRWLLMTDGSADKAGLGKELESLEQSQAALADRLGELRQVE